MEGLKTPRQLRRETPAWVATWMSAFLVGVACGWALTHAVYKLTEPAYQDVIDEAQRNMVRVLKQGMVPEVPGR